jgi:hypothetical protein
VPRARTPAPNLGRPVRAGADAVDGAFFSGRARACHGARGMGCPANLAGTDRRWSAGRPCTTIDQPAGRRRHAPSGRNAPGASNHVTCSNHTSSHDSELDKRRLIGGWVSAAQTASVLHIGRSARNPTLPSGLVAHDIRLFVAAPRVTLVPPTRVTETFRPNPTKAHRHRGRPTRETSSVANRGRPLQARA